MNEHIAEAMRAARWDERDIAVLLQVLPADRRCVLEQISPTRMRIAAHGALFINGSLVPHVRHIDWRATVAPASSAGCADDRAWCPAHGLACHPHDGGCGAAVLRTIVCRCPPRRHLETCDLSWFDGQEEPPPRAKTMPPPAPVATVKRKAKKPKKGTPLPGQIGLKL